MSGSWQSKIFVLIHIIVHLDWWCALPSNHWGSFGFKGQDDVGWLIKEREVSRTTIGSLACACQWMSFVDMGIFEHPSGTVKEAASRISHYSSDHRRPRSGTSLPSLLQSKTEGGPMSHILNWIASELLSHVLGIEKKRNVSISISICLSSIYLGIWEIRLVM